jgi:hypothetical protein
VAASDLRRLPGGVAAHDCFLSAAELAARERLGDQGRAQPDRRFAMKALAWPGR